MTFNPDSQNAGGRKAIVDYMTNHYATLFNAKPVINSHAPPHAHVDAGKPKKQKNTVRLDEQMEGFRRAKLARENPSRESHTDLEHDKPETFDMAAQLSKAKSRRAGAMPSEHLNNIKHLQKRINSIGSMTDRKKNEFDVKAYPAVQIQREGAYAKAIRQTQDKPARSKTAAKGIQTPQVATDDPNPGTEMKRQLLELIVENQWTDDDSLSALYDRTREAHLHLSPAIVEESIAFVQYSLDHADEDSVA